jgi:hypothetical protein
MGAHDMVCLPTSTKNITSMKDQSLRAGFILFFALALLFQAKAQTLTFDNFNAPGFRGVKKLNGENGFYFSYVGEKAATKGLFQIVTEVYDNSLENKKQIIVEASRDAEVVSAMYSEGNYFLFLKNKFKRTYHFVSVDAEGKVIGRRDSEKINDAIGNPRILQLAKGEFLIVESKSVVRSHLKYISFQIEKVNSKLESVLKFESPKESKKNYLVLDAIVDGDKLHLLTQDQIGSDMVKQLIIGYDLKVGTELYQYKLYDDKFSGFPTFIKTNKNGEVVTGGPYFIGGWVDEWNSDGIFSAVIGIDGKQKSLFQSKWKDIQDQVKSDASWNYFSTKSMVFVEDVYINNDNSFYLIAENFRVNNGVTSSKIALNLAMKTPTNLSDRILTVEDILLFKFDSQGKYVGIDRAVKQPKQMKIEQNATNTTKYGYLELATKISKEGLFPYRETITVQNTPYLVFINPDGMQEKASFASFTNRISNTYPSIELKYSDINSKGLNSLQKASGNVQSVYIDDDGDVSGGTGFYKGMLPTNSGKILIYHFNVIAKGRPFKLWMESIPSK